MFVRLSKNKYGTKVSIHTCESCGKEFTVCPAKPDGFKNCLRPECSSYDPDCDLDRLFEPTTTIGNITYVNKRFQEKRGIIKNKE